LANDLTTWDIEHYKPLNDMGIATPIVSGNLFRFRLRFGTIYEIQELAILRYVIR